MSSTPRDTILSSLRAEIDRLLVPLIAGHERHICLIDPPTHGNVGDSAILLGQLDFLAAHFPGARLSFFDVNSYSPAADRHIEQASLILLHGGGNFGDLWPRHHDLRLRILEQFAHKRIIQLPQSITFSSAQTLAITAQAIARQSDFHLLVRDSQSLAKAREAFACAISLAPDMAFYLRPLQRLPASAEWLCLLRSDKEAAADHDRIVAEFRRQNADFRVEDWLDEPGGLLPKADDRLGRFIRRYPASGSPLMPLGVAVRRRHALRRLQRGVATLSQGRRVLTDRLHVHILCFLLGIPHWLLDSLDGKIFALHATWTTGNGLTTLIDDPRQLAEIALNSGSEALR